MANKLTKREVIAMMLKEEVIASNPVYAEFLTHYDEQLSARKDSEKDTKRKADNEVYKAYILETLATVEKATVSEIQALDERISPILFSNQKITSLIKALCTEGKVVKIPMGKKSYFALA